MNVLELTLGLAAVSVAAGFLGSLTGLEGGVVIVPTLALGFAVDIRYVPESRGRDRSIIRDDGDWRAPRATSARRGRRKGTHHE